MSIEMTCPQCSAHFSFADTWAGKRARCQRCQNTFVIPAADSPPPPKLLDIDINLELIDDPPPKSKPAEEPPALTMPLPEEPAEALDVDPLPEARPEPPRALPARRSPDPEDFDLEECRPSRRRKRYDDEDEEDDRPSRRRRRRSDDDDDEPAFTRMQRRRIDPEERGVGQHPLWLKFLLFAIVLAVTAGQKVYWLEDKDKEQGTFAKMKKKLIGFAIVAILLLFTVCGGLFFVLFTLFRGGFGPPAPHGGPPGPQPAPRPGPAAPGPVQPVWAAQPDPLPDWNDWKPAAALAVELKNNDHVWYPERPSRFVAVGRPGRNLEVTVWNIETNQEVGKISDARSPLTKGALSPDGQYLAFWRGSEISVFSSRTGKKQHSLRARQGSSPVWLDFHAPDRLIGLFRWGGKHRVETWDLKTGGGGGFEATLEQEVVGAPALSPNGRYLAHLSRRSLEVYDLQGGVPTNRLPVLNDPQTEISDCLALTFAPDGQAVAALIHHQGAEHIVEWDVNAGRIARELKAPPVGGGFPGRRLEWLPQRRGWLLHGSTFVDGNAAPKEILPFDPADRYGLRRVVNDEQLLLVRREGARLLIGTRPLPK